MYFIDVFYRRLQPINLLINLPTLFHHMLYFLLRLAPLPRPRYVVHCMLPSLKGVGIFIFKSISFSLLFQSQAWADRVEVRAHKERVGNEDGEDYERCQGREGRVGGKRRRGIEVY